MRYHIVASSSCGESGEYYMVEAENKTFAIEKIKNDLPSGEWGIYSKNLEDGFEKELDLIIK
jgi:hypothetical protein